MKRLLLVFTCFLFLVSSVSAYELEFYHSDHLGSPVVVTGESGETVWSSDYDVFGEAVNEQGDGDLLYNQKEKDDTGLLYYGARYYNTKLGRFITADTMKGSAGSLQSQNLYVYVMNNPMKYIDPTGHQNVNSEATRVYNDGNPDESYFAAKANIQSSLGPAPIGTVGDLAKYPELANDVLSAANEMKIDPALLFASISQEGLTSVLLTSNYGSEMLLNTYGSIGVDALFLDLPRLQAKGMLSDLNEDMLGDSAFSIKNEAGLEVLVGQLAVKDIIRGVAAELKWRQDDYFFKDLRSIGVDPSSISSVERDWWTYAYYNMGQGNAGKMLKKNGVDFMYSKSNYNPSYWSSKVGAGISSNIFFNAGRAAGGAELLRQTGVFKEG